MAGPARLDFVTSNVGEQIQRAQAASDKKMADAQNMQIRQEQADRLQQTHQRGVDYDKALAEYNPQGATYSTGEITPGQNPVGNPGAAPPVHGPLRRVDTPVNSPYFGQLHQAQYMKNKGFGVEGETLRQTASASQQQIMKQMFKALANKQPTQAQYFAQQIGYQLSGDDLHNAKVGKAYEALIDVVEAYSYNPELQKQVAMAVKTMVDRGIQTGKVMTREEILESLDKVEGYKLDKNVFKGKPIAVQKDGKTVWETPSGAIGQEVGSGKASTHKPEYKTVIGPEGKPVYMEIGKAAAEKYAPSYKPAPAAAPAKPVAIVGEDGKTPVFVPPGESYQKQPYYKPSTAATNDPVKNFKTPTGIVPMRVSEGAQKGFPIVGPLSQASVVDPVKNFKLPDGTFKAMPVSEGLKAGYAIAGPVSQTIQKDPTQNFKKPDGSIVPMKTSEGLTAGYPIAGVVSATDNRHKSMTVNQLWKAMERASTTGKGSLGGEVTDLDALRRQWVATYPNIPLPIGPDGNILPPPADATEAPQPGAGVNVAPQTNAAPQLPAFMQNQLAK
jgi:hypothetical protein